MITDFERRKRILERIAQFVQSCDHSELREAIEADDITYEEILAKFNLELVRAVRGTH